MFSAEHALYFSIYLGPRYHYSIHLRDRNTSKYSQLGYVNSTLSSSSLILDIVHFPLHPLAEQFPVFEALANPNRNGVIRRGQTYGDFGE